MTQFNFQENAKAIFEKSISSTPVLFRKRVKNGLVALLLKQYGEGAEVTEAQLVEVIKENTPAAFVKLGISAIKPLITDPSLADL